MTSIHRVEQVQSQFIQLAEHLRAEIKTIEDPSCKALFETAAEVILGLDTAFEHYKKHEEAAWK